MFYAYCKGYKVILAKELSYRERYLWTVAFKPVDTLPLEHAYGLMPGVLEEWHAQGLPESIKSDEDIRKYFAFPQHARSLPLNIGFSPPFPTRIIQETDEYRIATDSLGRTTKVYKDISTIALPLGFPVKDYETWQPYRERLQFFPERIGRNLESIAEANIAEGRLNQFSAKGFYWFPRDLMGDEALCIAYYEKSDLIQDIVESWCSLLEQVIEGALKRIKLDRIHLNEDMAYRNASIIGKSLFDEFMHPYYMRIRRLVEKYKVPVFSMDSDGCLQELGQWWKECGANLIGPNEIQAGNDIIAYRKKYGQEMAYFGGLDKRVLPTGKQAINDMLDSTIPYMKSTGGGWIVSLDHRVISGTRLDDFQYYLDRARELARY